jgi:hypothetical protein
MVHSIQPDSAASFTTSSVQVSIAVVGHHVHTSASSLPPHHSTGKLVQFSCILAAKVTKYEIIFHKNRAINGQLSKQAS